MKKLVTASNKKDNQDLRPWLKYVSNHLYWSCSSANGDPEKCLQRWRSLLHHICGVHRWEEDGVEHVCHHPAMTEEQQRKKWLQVESSAFKALKSVVMDNNLLRDLKQMDRSRCITLQCWSTQKRGYTSSTTPWGLVPSWPSWITMPVLAEHRLLPKKDNHGTDIVIPNKVHNGLRSPCTHPAGILWRPCGACPEEEGGSNCDLYKAVAPSSTTQKKTSAKHCTCS